MRGAVAEDSTNDPGAIAALIAVTEPPSEHDDPTGEMARLLRAVVDALGGRAAVLQAADPREGCFTVVGSVNIPALAPGMDNAPLSDGVAGQAHGEGVELDVDEGTLPEALRLAGFNYALALPVRSSERSLGVVWVAGTEPLSEDPLRRHAARVGAERIGTLLEQVRLHETLERAMAQILEGDERMLGRIGLDIHDGPTQQLSVALLEVQLLDADLNDAEAAGAVLPDKLRPGLNRIYETLGGALQEMRELIGHLRPAQFEDRSLPEVLSNAIRVFESQQGWTVDYQTLGEFPDKRVSLSQKITFYRILQEALNNAARHGAASEVAVRLREGPAGITMEVRDNGRGFEPEEVRRPTPGNPQVRYGLFGMRDRAQLLGGSLEIWSRPGVGSLITVFLPRWRGAERGRLARIGA
jgi:signal transduction histidine kinase